MVQGGFWNDRTGELEEGVIDVDDLNLVLEDMPLEQQGIDTIQLKKEGKVAKLLLTFR